jgi:hypothetical protein
MTEVPKIVRDRLQAGLTLPGASEPLHPDADLLTAFAEQALPVNERERVLEHLAICGDCREVVAWALPDANVVGTPIAADAEIAPATATRTKVPARHGLRLAWPSLRWAALAVGVAVAAVLLVRAGRQPVSTHQIASLPASVPSPATTFPTDQPALSGKAVATKTDAGEAKSERTLSKKASARLPMPSPQAEPGMLLADNRTFGHAGKLPAASSARSQTTAHDARPGSGVTGTIDTADGSGAIAVTPSSRGTLVARNDAPVIDGQMMDAPPVEKAKPAPPETEANELKEAPAARSPSRSMMSAMRVTSGASLTLTPNTTWAIKAGVLQRSLDNGKSWQGALHADHPLLCYAIQGTDVWAGGSAGALFHSADGGATWLPVQPSFDARPLSADVTHIDLTHNVQADVAGRTRIALSTSNNEVWSSVDGGKTWTKNAAENK